MDATSSGLNSSRAFPRENSTLSGPHNGTVTNLITLFACRPARRFL
jgi:hypothetical protein